MDAILNNTLSSASSLAVSYPIVSREKFAQLVGLPHGVIVGMCNKGLLPTVKIGKYSLINLEALRHQCAEKGLM